MKHIRLLRLELRIGQRAPLTQRGEPFYLHVMPLDANGRDVAVSVRELSPAPVLSIAGLFSTYTLYCLTLLPGSSV